MRSVVCLLNLWLSATGVAAQDVSLNPLDLGSQTLGASMEDLAERTLVLSGSAPLATQGALQLATRRYADARQTIAATASAGNPSVPSLAMEVFAEAKVREQRGESFEAAYLAAYEAVVGPLSDRTAYDVYWFLGRLPEFNRQDFARLVAGYRAPTRITQAQAGELVRAYVWWQASVQFWPVLSRAIAADDRRRYVVDDDIRVHTPDRATVTAVLMRPRTMTRVPTLLAFGIYAMPNSLEDAREAASHGYASVLGFSRGKYHSTDPITPFDHDADDARALIEWIATQSWSDGRVGMYGGSYLAFVQWAVAKHPPTALKAMMPSAPLVPGIAGPMEGNLFLNYQYAFVPYVTHGRFLDEQGYSDFKHWDGLNRAWYTSGRPYRDLEHIDGTPNPLYTRLLRHPSYDAFWQQFTPQGHEFSRVNIPVLVVTGYYDGAQAGARYLFDEHRRFNPNADETVMIGPFSHTGAQHQADGIVGGYRIDPVARTDFHDLRYAWFDYVLRGARRPDLLSDRINYEVMGANTWRHAPSFAAMSNATAQYHLVPAGPSAANRLATDAPPIESAVELVVNLADRRDVDWLPQNMNVNASLDTHNAVVYRSDPFTVDTEISGLISGTLDFEMNKRDMDLVIRVYEQNAAGEFLELSQPYLQRASYIRDRSHRQLFEAGRRQTLAFEKPGPVSRLIKRGSRLVFLLGVQKERDAQINYGTGKDVSTESISDAGESLKVRWFSTSVVRFPVHKN